MSYSSLPPVVVVGSINVDLTAVADRLPTPGETIAGGTLRRELGGKGANQATAAARLGADVRMIGAVGADADGEWMLRDIHAAGVDTSSVRVSGRPTGTALIVVDRAAENQIVVCPGANADVSLEGFTFTSEDVVLAQLEVSMDLVLELSQKVPGFLAVNAAPAQTLPDALIERVDLFIVNESEHALMPELARARLVAVTFGADGAAIFKDGQEVARAAGVPTVAVNTVGAGDAFCAALVLALRAGGTYHDALRTACAVGAAAVTHAASQPPFERLDTYSAQA